MWKNIEKRKTGIKIKRIGGQRWYLTRNKVSRERRGPEIAMNKREQVLIRNQIRSDRKAEEALS